MDLLFTGRKGCPVALCFYFMVLTCVWQSVQSQCNITIEDELWPKQWFLNATADDKYDMNVLPAWKSCVNGTGVTVGVVDKGVQDHIDLNIDRQLSFGDVTGASSISLQHGTRVAGLIAARKNKNFTIGIAFGSKIADIKIASRSVFDTFDPASLTHNMQDVHVYSCSFANSHTGSKTYPLLKEQEDALKRGTSQGRSGLGSVYVFATGNTGDENELFPDSCAYDRLVTNRYVISVAGIQHDLSKVPTGEACSAMMVAAFTARAGAVDHKLVTTNVGNTSTEYFNQNSAAVPMVSGAIALALSANPGLRYRDVMHLLVKTSRSEMPEFQQHFQKNAANLSVSSLFGFGLLDIGELVAASRKWTNVPDVLSCSVTNPNNNFVKSACHTVHLKCSDVTYIEHVEVSLRVDHPNAGQIRWFLVSPNGTRSLILPGRELDSQTNMNHTVLTIQMWGENPNGYWRLEPTPMYDKTLDGGTVKSFELTVYGFRCTSNMSNFKCLPAARQDPSLFTTCTTPPDVTEDTGKTPEDPGLSKTAIVLLIVIPLVLIFIAGCLALCAVKKLMCFRDLELSKDNCCSRAERTHTEQDIPLKA